MKINTLILLIFVKNGLWEDAVGKRPSFVNIENGQNGRSKQNVRTVSHEQNCYLTIAG